MDCLVTKLRGEVANEHLMRLGEFRLKIDKQASDVDFSKRAVGLKNSSATENVEIEVIGGYLTDSTGTQNLGTSTTIPPTQKATVTLYFSNDDCTISVRSKYNVVVVNAEKGGNLVYMDITELNYLAANNQSETLLVNLQNTNNTGNLDVIYGRIDQLVIQGNVGGNVSGFTFNEGVTIICNNTNFYGDLNLSNFTRVNFSNCKGINFDLAKLNGRTFTQLLLNGCNVVGDVSNISSASMRRLELQNCQNVVGSVESLIQNLWSAGQRANNVILLINGTGVTFGEKVLSEGLSCQFSSNNVTISGYGSGALYGTYNGTAWSYAQ